MYHIYLDESDSKGAYFSNFYGGIIIDASDLEEFCSRINKKALEVGICDEEIKWQKVNSYTLDKYQSIIDMLFDLLEEGKARIRIFFRHNRNNPGEKLQVDKSGRYTKLYYQFIKHGFGLAYAPYDSDNRIRLFIDEMPINNSQRTTFLSYLYGFNRLPMFKRNGTQIIANGIAEVKSHKHVPLQVMDIVLGAMCFRLNNKHLLRNAETGRRGNRTICREKLYKHILQRICLLTERKFNIGDSTGISSISERWSAPYLHWKFIPNDSSITEEYDKH